MSKILKISPIVTSGYREIRDGSRYDKYFPKVDEQERMIVGDRSAEVDDVVELMQKVVKKYQDDTKAIAQLLKGASTEQTITNIWKFLYHHIQYKLDKSGLEELRRPARLWHDKEGDCDDFAMAASSILNNLGIKNAFRITKYGKPYFQHVYVVIPHDKGYYKIDPVLSKANYEKPFTEKKDFTMSLDGINVAVLSGLGNEFEPTEKLLDDMMLSGFDGIDGLGAISQERANDKVFKNLVATRAFAAKNKQGIAMFTNPDKYLKELDYAIKYWHTPQRDKALAILAENEQKENERNAQFIEGLGEIDFDSFFLDDTGELEGLGSWFKKKWNKLKKTHKKVWKTVKTGVKKGWSKVKKVAKNVLVRFNPAVMLLRGGILLVLKHGIFPFPKMKKRIKWAFASDTQLKKAGISKNYRAKNQRVLAELEKRFVKAGGKKAESKKGDSTWKKGQLASPFDTDIIQGLGDGGISAAAMVAAATAVLTAINKLFKKNKVGDPEKATTKKAKPTKKMEAKSMPEINLSPKDLSEFMPRDENMPNIELPNKASKSQNITPSKTALQDKTIPKDKAVQEPIPTEPIQDDNKPKQAGFLAQIKKNPLIAVLGLGLLSGLTYMGIQNFKKKIKQQNQVRAFQDIPEAKNTKVKPSPKP